MAPLRVEALFADPRSHLTALAVLAAENLQNGDYAAAFRYADRRCRLLKPSARDYLLRSEASRRAGFPEEAVLDLERSIELDPSDRTVLHVAMKWGSAAQKVAAARFEAEDSPLSSASRRPGDRRPATSGLVPAAGEAPAFLAIVIAVYEDFEATRACFEAVFAQGAETPARIIAVDDASPNAALGPWLDAQAEAGRLVLLRNETNLGFAASVNRALALCPTGDVLLLNADALPPPGNSARLGAVAHSAPQIGTVTPLSNNGEYTSFPTPNAPNPLGGPDEVARLDALARKASGGDFVDLPNGIGFCLYITRACLDAVGPLPELYARGYYEDVEFCLRARERGFRNVCATGIYVGHAGAASFGAQKRWLVMRNLAILDRRFPDYRLESASFLAADPLRAARGAIEILSPNSSPTVLLVCAGGASLFLAHERAGEMAARGESAPLVCACDSASRVSLLGAPGHSPQSLSFRLDEAGLPGLLDYLRAIEIVRIELFDPLSLPVSLLTPLFRFGAPVDLAGGDLEWALSLRHPFAGPCPTPDDSAPCPACAVGAFSARDDDGFRSAHLARKRRILSRARAIRPLDRMADVFARHIFGDSFVSEVEPGEFEGVDVATVPLPRRGGDRVLVVIMPLPDPLADRLMVALGRALLKKDRTARIVVLGACVNDLAAMAPGNVFVAGAVETGEYERLLRQYEATALMAPYRTRFFGRADLLSRRFALPLAYFDYSMGKLPRAEGDLAMDPRLCEEKATVGIADWLLARSNAAPTS